MSRGPGRVMRAVLDEVVALPPPENPEWPFTALAPVHQIAAGLFGGEPTVSQMVSVRRAVRTLERGGMVTTRGVRVGNCAPRKWLTGVRAPLTDEEVAAHTSALAALRWVEGSYAGDLENRFYTPPPVSVSLPPRGTR